VEAHSPSSRDCVTHPLAPVPQWRCHPRSQIVYCSLHFKCCLLQFHVSSAASSRFGSSSTAVFSSPKRSNLCQDNIVFLLHQSWKLQHRQTYIPPTISSHIDHLVPSHQHQIEHYQSTDSNCTRQVVNQEQKSSLFHRGKCQILPDYFLPPPQPNFLIFPSNREQNFRKYIIENNITEDRTS